jgi:histidine triad (HIT) family protein
MSNKIEEMTLKSHFIYILSRVSRIFYQMSNFCIFCKIVSNEANATIVYRDEQVTAFRDIHPVAPTRILIVPNKHIESVNTLEMEDEPLMGHIFAVARKLASDEGIATGGYRIITNTGANGGQTVFHLHVHLIGGQRMKHPMG